MFQVNTLVFVIVSLLLSRKALAEVTCHCNAAITSTACYGEEVRHICENATRKVLDEYINGGLLSNCAKLPMDCTDLRNDGHNQSGVYTIYPHGKIGIDVRCDMETDSGGWTVFQRRISDSDFYKTWNEYQVGFGDLNSNFWLGNQFLAVMTNKGWYELRIDLTHPTTGEVRYAAYQVFSVGDVLTKYILHVDGYHGNAGNSLDHHDGRRFSTPDQDNDDYTGDCAEAYHGAWWYGLCHNSNLNGEYGSTVENVGLIWEYWTGTKISLSGTEMKMRRKS